ncbi:MAG TPA: FxsA family protein [Mariprofundaceae bacterium]|nr:FxsA family protein [Mariprofundaceae bacterium]
MIRLLLLLLVFLPLIELYVLIEVGSRIGGAATILLCLATAAIGGWLVRVQGLQTLFTARRHMMAGQIPAESMAHGLMLSLAGVLLLTPGFVTDIIGFLLLIPALRRVIIHRWIPRAFSASGQTTWIEAEVVETHDDQRPPLH